MKSWLNITRGDHINDLVQDCSNSNALAMELLQSCAKPSIRPLCQHGDNVELSNSWYLLHILFYQFTRYYDADAMMQTPTLGGPDVTLLNRYVILGFGFSAADQLFTLVYSKCHAYLQNVRTKSPCPVENVPTPGQLAWAKTTQHIF